MTSGTYPWSFVTQIFHNGQPILGQGNYGVSGLDDYQRFNFMWPDENTGVASTFFKPSLRKYGLLFPKAQFQKFVAMNICLKIIQPLQTDLSVVLETTTGINTLSYIQQFYMNGQ